MACVLCGKKQRILPLDTVKYPTENSLPKVLSVAIGDKITEQNWNDGEKHICLSCNKKCKQFDDLNTKLQDLKDHLFQEYTKRIFLESKTSHDDSTKVKENKAKDNEPDKLITANEDTVEDAGGIEINSNEKGTEHSETESGEKAINSSEKDAESIEIGIDDPEKKNNVHDKEPQKERQDLDEMQQNTRDDNDDDMETDKSESSSILPTITITIKHEGDGSSSDDELQLRNWTNSENLPQQLPIEYDALADETQAEQIRLLDKSKLQRLPDYEYNQWYTLDGYSYMVLKQNSRRELLVCHQHGCRVCVRVARQGQLVKLVGAHRHEPDPRVPERNLLYQKLKDRCLKDQNTPLIKMYEEEAQRYPGGAVYLPFPETRMREWRAANDQTVTDNTNASELEDCTKKYRCDVCNMGFNSSRLLAKHADKHNKSKTKRKKLSGVESFIASTPITEKTSLKKLSDKKLKRVNTKIKPEDESAAETESEDLKECHKCHDQFTTLEKLKNHILNKHSEILMCVHCDIAFDTPLLLKRHQTSCRKCCDERILKQHNQNLEDDQIARELSKITGQDISEDLKADLDPDDPVYGVGKSDTSADEGIEETVPKKKKKPNKEKEKLEPCRLCDKTFPSSDQLKRHLYTHSSRDKYECGTCGLSFKIKAVLTRHMISENHKTPMKVNPPRPETMFRVPTGEARGKCKFECAVCSASYPRQEALLHHMREMKHITDQIIIHEAQEVSPAMLRPVKRNTKYYRDISNNINTKPTAGPVSVDGVRFNTKQSVEQAWHSLGGKKPLECAVCGEGFDSKVKLFAHMDSEGHLSDSIVENVPVLEELAALAENGEENQIVPRDLTDEAVQIKEEHRVEILSQVIIPPNGETFKEELPDEETQDSQSGYFIQAAENAEGETVMVIQGDLAGSLTDNMQLFMDEHGNIVTQDEEGNTVQVMRLDLAKMQEDAARETFERDSGYAMDQTDSESQEDNRRVCENSQPTNVTENMHSTDENPIRLEVNTAEFDMAHEHRSEKLRESTEKIVELDSSIDKDEPASKTSEDVSSEVIPKTNEISEVSAEINEDECKSFKGEAKVVADSCNDVDDGNARTTDASDITNQSISNTNEFCAKNVVHYDDISKDEKTENKEKAAENEEEASENKKEVEKDTNKMETKEESNHMKQDREQIEEGKTKITSVTLRTTRRSIKVESQKTEQTRTSNRLRRPKKLS